MTENTAKMTNNESVVKITFKLYLNVLKKLLKYNYEYSEKRVFNTSKLYLRVNTVRALSFNLKFSS